MGTIDRREQKRVPARFEVNFIHQGDYLISFSENISVDGMFLFTETPPRVGDTTKLTFSVGDLQEESVEAKVMWVNQNGSSDDAGIGVQFINPSQHLKEAMLHVVKRVALFDEKQF